MWLVSKVGEAISAQSGPRQFSLTGQKWEERKLLGEGGFGYVYAVENVTTGRHAALKLLNCSSNEQEQAARREVNLLKTLKSHPNIVEFYDAGSTNTERGNEIIILMELCQGSLIDLMKNRAASNSKLSEKEVFEIFYEVCLGIEALHNRETPIIHRDIKPENVLKSRSGAWKLCDFGSCTTTVYDCSNERDRNRADTDIQRNTTMQYRAPEMVDLLRKQMIDERSDIWALGTLFYTLLFFEAPFTDSSLGILNCSYYLPDKFPYSAKAEQLLKRLIVPNPADRPHIHTILEWLEKILGQPVQARTRLSPQRASNTSTGSASTFYSPTPAVSHPAPERPAPANMNVGTSNLFTILEGGSSSPSPPPATPQPANKQPAPSFEEFFSPTPGPTTSTNPAPSTNFANFANFGNFPAPTSNPTPQTISSHTSNNSAPWDPWSSGSSSPQGSRAPSTNSTPRSPLAPAPNITNSNQNNSNSGLGAAVGGFDFATHFQSKSAQPSPVAARATSLSDTMWNSAPNSPNVPVAVDFGLSSLSISGGGNSEENLLNGLTRAAEGLASSGSDPEKALNSVVEFHQAMQKAYSQKVFSAAQSKKGAVEKLTQSTLSFMSTQQDTKMISSKYAQALAAKLAFHAQYPDFEGSYSVKTAAKAQNTDEKTFLEKSIS